MPLTEASTHLSLQPIAYALGKKHFPHPPQIQKTFHLYLAASLLLLPTLSRETLKSTRPLIQKIALLASNLKYLQPLLRKHQLAKKAPLR